MCKGGNYCCHLRNKPISHNALVPYPIQKCTHNCSKVVKCGIWGRYIVGVTNCLLSTSPARGSSGNPCSEMYRGSEPFSEPETRAISSFLLQLKGRIKLYLTFHSYGQLWLTPWGYTSQVPEDYKKLVGAYACIIVEKVLSWSAPVISACDTIILVAFTKFTVNVLFALVLFFQQYDLV